MRSTQHVLRQLQLRRCGAAALLAKLLLYTCQHGPAVAELQADVVLQLLG